MIRILVALCVAVFSITTAIAGDSSQKLPMPTTAKRPVVDTYWGEKITDDYRWLEDWNDSSVRAWSEAENAYTRQLIDGLPGRAEIRARATSLLSGKSASYNGLVLCGSWLFAIKNQPPKQQSFLVVLKSPSETSTERVVVDPIVLEPTGATSIDFFEPSRDGRLVAVSLSKSGSESGDVHVFEVATGKPTGDVIPRVNGGTAGGSVAWNADNTGFYYTRYPRSGERPAADLDFFQQVYFHRLGTPGESDVYAIGKEFPRVAEIVLQSSEDGRYFLAQVANGDGGEFAFYLLAPDGKWQQISTFADKIVGGQFGPDGSLYLISRQGAPLGKVVRLSQGEVNLAAAKVIVPASEGAIEAIYPTAHNVYVRELVGGPTRVRVFDLGGRPLGAMPLPESCSAGQISRLAGDTVLIKVVTLLTPAAWFTFSPEAGKLTPTALVQTSPADFMDCETIREMVVTKDGTKIPLTILQRKGTPRDGANPTLLTGYGGFGISISPSFSAIDRLWVEQGGVVAIANLRGGGEFGEVWHDQGKLLQKQNVFDDFIACARYLIASRITSPAKLAIEGGSNGGLLMGAALTQAPELFAAVVSHVGIYDMLRVELSSNGVFNITEYGTVKDKEQYKALAGYSPYHHVKGGVPYPAVLLLTGANDARVDPMQSRKMCARLQGASASGKPVLLRTSSSTGHGGGTPLAARIEQVVDVYTFLFDQLKVQYRPGK